MPKAGDAVVLSTMHEATFFITSSADTITKTTDSQDKSFPRVVTRRGQHFHKYGTKEKKGDIQNIETFCRTLSILSRVEPSTCLSSSSGKVEGVEHGSTRITAVGHDTRGGDEKSDKGNSKYILIHVPLPAKTATKEILKRATKPPRQALSKTRALGAFISGHV